jgi:hypothetical protein
LLRNITDILTNCPAYPVKNVTKNKKNFKIGKNYKKTPPSRGRGIGLVTDLVTDCADYNTRNQK